MNTRRLFCLGLVAGLLAGCSKPQSPAPAAAAAHHHEHHPPHGGTPVELGQEQYHVEFVLDAPAGKLQAFILDGELENFVRISAPSLEVVAQVSGHPETLRFQPIANSATGETAGDTSLFEAQAKWLEHTATFDAVLKQVVVRGQTYTNVDFNFPKGSDEGARKKSLETQRLK